MQEIAWVLNRNRRTVERALIRFKPPWYMKLASPYDKAKYSWDQAKLMRSAPRKREWLKCKFIRDYVEEGLRGKISPELIAGRLSVFHPEYSISYEAIYEWIFRERRDLAKFLLRAGKKRQGKPGARAYPKRQPAAPKKSIDIRFEEANNRSRLGDSESDLIVGGCGEACLLVFVDRRARQLRLRKLPNRKAETVRQALVEIMHRIPKHLRHSLTQDNGSEHALHAELEKALGISVFFCHPYSAWERGTVENRNGIIRRYFPKGTNFNLVTDEQVQWVEDKINSTPMKLLGFLTPDEFYQREELKLVA